MAQRAGHQDGEEDAEARSLAFQRLTREVLLAERGALPPCTATARSGEVLHHLEREIDLHDQRLEL